jgi:IS605 OrfB family transposase
MWQEEKGKGNPWNLHRLTLHCSLDTQFWTEEGTAQIQQEKVTQLAKNQLRMNPKLTSEIFFRSGCFTTYLTLWLIITSYRTLTFLEKGDLSKAQKDFQSALKRIESSLERINLSYSRPHKPLYNGHSHILVGVAMGLEQPATVAVVDGTTGQAITFRSLKQLLGKNYKLLNRQRHQKQQNAHQRHKAQKQKANNQFGESDLGQYIDRLLAKAIVTLAQTYQAASIVVPKLGDIREIIQTEIKAKAEQKIPGYIEGQEKYAKQYRINIHQWSYGRLIDNIKTQASKVGIVIEQGEQGKSGSPQDKAKEIALMAYHSRRLSQ